MKNLLMKIIFRFLYRGIKVLNGRDELITEEIKKIPENYKILILTDLKNGKFLAIQKKNGKIEKIKIKNNMELIYFNLVIKFKNKDLAFKVLMGKKGISQAFAEHYFILYGNIYEAMGFTRILERVEGYLFPKFISKKILKEPVEREISILKTYLLCLLGR